MQGHGFSEAVARKPFLDPDSGVAVFSGAVARKNREFFLGPDSANRNYLLLLSNVRQ